MLNSLSKSILSYFDYQKCLSPANNATNVWQELFRIYLSGTAVPFIERIDLLEKRLSSENEEEINLALECLTKAFDTRGSRIVGSPLIAGRISPENWQPQTQVELKECFDRAFAVLSKAVQSNIDSLKTGALNIAIERIPILLTNGYLEEVQALFSADDISQEILVSLIRRLEDFLEFNSDASGEIQQWLESLIPEDFHGRLIQTVSKSPPWSSSFQDSREAWQQEINSLARQLYEDRALLKSEMEWLVSPQAIMVENLGSRIGQYDADASCLDMIMKSVAETQATGLARGYIVGLLNSYPQHKTIVNQWIDKFETQIPTVAYELFRAGGENTKAVERALKLVDEGSLDLDYLGGFFPGLLSTEEFYEILARLLNSVKKENHSATKIANKLIAQRIYIDQRENNKIIIEETKIQNLVWQFLEATCQYIKSEAYNWEIILRSAAKLDVEKAVKIASLAILSKNYQQKMNAEKFLVDLAKSYSDLVMENVGKIILDDEHGWHFEIEQYRFLIENLPLEAMKQWLNSVGVAGARRIAKQLSLPYLDEKYQPVVPPLTEFVLSEFESDEDIFRNFCVSSHNHQVYTGDMVAHKNKEIEIARSFLNHPMRRIREWATKEIRSCQLDAKYYQQIDEETWIR